MKTTDEIYSSLAAVFADSAGAEPVKGGDMYLRLYAVAAEIATLYAELEWTKRQCFPQTADRLYLERHAQVRGLSRGGAVKATGVLRFALSEAAAEDVSIAAGTTCLTSGLVSFVTTAAGVIPAGELYCDVPAVAVEAGADGNVAAGTVVHMGVAPLGVTGCTNQLSFTGGADAEDDQSLRQRVLDSYNSLPNGANVAFYRERALAFPGIAAVSVLPRARGVGTVDLVAATVEGVPGTAELSALEASLQAMREIAVDLDVRAPDTVPVDVSVSVTIDGTKSAAAVLAAVEAALRAHFTGERLGQSVLLARLGSVVYAVDGVLNYSFSAPAADLAIDPDELPVLGALTVTEVE